MLLLLGNVVYFVHDLFIHYPLKTSGTWLYGYEQSITYVKKVQNNYKEIDMTQELGRPYIYYLFYLKMSPQEFRQTANIKRDTFGFVNVEEFGKYHFPVKMPNALESGVLYINTPDAVVDHVHVVKEFFALNGDKVLVAYTK